MNYHYPGFSKVSDMPGAAGDGSVIQSVIQYTEL